MILAADIGGTKIAAARVSPDGRLDGPVRQVPTPARDGADPVVAATAELLAELDAADVDLIGVASAGVIDTAGRVLAATDSLSGWAGTPLAERLAARFDRPVHVLGDGHAFGVGEACYGAGRGHDSLLLLAVGTGVGGSHVVGGEPALGSHHVAGHVGHLVVPQADDLPCPCGRRGHLEAIASGTAMLAWYHRHGGSPKARTTRDLAERAEDGLAGTALALGAAAVGTAAGGLANVLDPGVVVVTGGVAASGPRWESALREAFDRSLMPALDGLPLTVSSGGVSTALRGAAAYALQRSVA